MSVCMLESYQNAGSVIIYTLRDFFLNLSLSQDAFCLRLGVPKPNLVKKVARDLSPFGDDFSSPLGNSSLQKTCL